MPDQVDIRSIKVAPDKTRAAKFEYTFGLLVNGLPALRVVRANDAESAVAQIAEVYGVSPADVGPVKGR